MNPIDASAALLAPITLPNEIAEFIESGVSIILGVADSDGRAHAGRALGSRVIVPGTIRIIFSAEGNAAIEQSSARGGPIAVTFCAPLTHRTTQIKGRASKVEELEPEDLSSVNRQAAAFAAVLMAVGHTSAFAQAICEVHPASLRVISFPAQEAYEQTPGHGAGRAL